MENTSLVQNTNNTSSVINVDAAIQEWEDYQKFCSAALTSEDYQKIWVKEKDPETGEEIVVERAFKKKSAWLKLGRAFNVDTRIIDKEYTRSKTGHILEAYYLVEAILPNGRRVESDSLCSRTEKGKSKISNHAVIATAKTRATCRAIAELIGAGETSAEEMLADYEESANQIAESEAIAAIDTSSTEVISEDKENVPEDPDPQPDEMPELIENCINALLSQGRNPTNETVKLCIKDRCKDAEEYNVCMNWLEHNVDLGV